MDNTSYLLDRMWAEFPDFSLKVDPQTPLSYMTLTLGGHSWIVMNLRYETLLEAYIQLKVRHELSRIKQKE